MPLLLAIFTLMALTATAVPAWADNPFDLRDNPNPAMAGRQRQIGMVVEQCGRVYDAMFQRLAAQRDKVFHYAHNYNARDGFITNSPLNVFVRDTRITLISAREEFHRLYHRDDLVVDQCVNAAWRYRQVFDCFYQRTAENDVTGMRACAPAIYATMVNPDRFYGE